MSIQQIIGLLIIVGILAGITYTVYWAEKGRVNAAHALKVVLFVWAATVLILSLLGVATHLLSTN